MAGAIQTTSAVRTGASCTYKANMVRITEK
jgi:hypothetical protein